MRAQQTMTATEWVMLAALSVVWGGSFFFFKILVGELPVLTIVMVRVAAAAILLLAIVYVTGKSMPSSREVWVAFAVMGVFNNIVPFGLIIWGESQIQSGLASILNATSPLFSVVLAHFLTREERITPNRIAGVLIGLAGLAVLIGPKALGGLNLTSLAQLAVIAAAISYAWVAIYARRFKVLGISPLVTATGQLVASAIVVTPLALWIDHPWTLAHAPSAAAWLAMAGLVILSTVLAYIVYFRILASAGATNALLVTFLVPVSALLLGSAFLKERFALTDFVGLLLIGCGLAAIDGRILRAAKQRFAQGGRHRTRTPSGR
jgi:drug/metabolite transporter (DMT)-like permease